MPAQGGPQQTPCPIKVLKGHDMKKIATLMASALLLAGCSPVQSNETLTLVAHDSFAISDELIQAFESETGLKLEIIRAGDAGSLTNRLVLTKESPIADVVFGIDNTFRGVADENQIIAGELIEVNYSDVCFNYDIAWFESNKISPPNNFRDLVLPAYRGLTVVTNPLTSSPGLAFLGTTVSAFGEDGFEEYWQALKANDVKVASGWEEAYFTEFSGSAGAGNYPIVLSYSSSPAAEIRADGSAGTAALLNDCFRQIEYVGVLKGTSNLSGSKALIDFLLDEPFQSSMPDYMYVYPVNASAGVPDAWEKFAPAASSTLGSELNLEQGRVSWQQKWLAIFD
jgi:thiamine transport system substrate-binding protein